MPERDTEIVEAVARVMARYVEGSFSGGPDNRVIWRIHDSWDAGKIVAVFLTPREARDDRLRELNASAAIAAYEAALEKSGWAIVPMGPT